MERKNIDEIMEQFYEEYQEDPEGWSFWISPSPSSGDFYEAYIVHGDEAFFLKVESVFTPNPVGVGTKIKIEEGQLEKNLPDFGYRRFTREETRKFLENLPKPEEYESLAEFQSDLRESQSEIARKAMKKKPVPFGTAERGKELAALGPYSSKSPLSYVSEEQEELRRKLSKELERLINRDYPGHY